MGGGQKYGWTANALFAVEAAKRWAGDAITADAVMPTTSPRVHGVTGRYFEDCNEAEVTTDPGLQRGVWTHALDEEDAAHLWAVSETTLRPTR
ncbi:hypothetical protein ACFCYB_37660 [Streptomyces sp. NPDC056309]|uniref:hypothetical protein n=1 Tax=unclassified Streptomyces TaxID=2593676 RepID=UPI0035DE3780